MHPDAERLVLLALGDPHGYSAEDAAHAARCAACHAEIESLRLVGGLIAESAAEPPLQPVSESVWDRIAERTGQAGGPPSAGDAPSANGSLFLAATPSTGEAPSAGGPPEVGGSPEVATAEGADLGGPPPVGGSPRRGGSGAARRRAAGRRSGQGWLRRHGPAALAGAAAGIAATLVVTAAVPSASDAGTVVATARLAPQPGTSGTAGGTVTVVDEGGGRLVARLAMSGLPDPDGLFELWLYDGSATMIPLGVTRGAAVELPVPAGVALRDYPVVDVSHQHTGQQEHGTSVLQGRLAA